VRLVKCRVRTRARRTSRYIRGRYTFHTCLSDWTVDGIDESTEDRQDDHKERVPFTYRRALEQIQNLAVWTLSAYKGFYFDLVGHATAQCQPRVVLESDDQRPERCPLDHAQHGAGRQAQLRQASANVVSAANPDQPDRFSRSDHRQAHVIYSFAVTDPSISTVTFAASVLRKLKLYPLT